MRRREFGFNLQLLSDGEIPIKEINVAALLKGHKFTISQVCYAIILIINNIGLSKTFVSCSGNIVKVKKFYKLGAKS